MVIIYMTLFNSCTLANNGFLLSVFIFITRQIFIPSVTRNGSLSKGEREADLKNKASSKLIYSVNGLSCENKD